MVGNILHQPASVVQSNHDFQTLRVATAPFAGRTTANTIALEDVSHSRGGIMKCLSDRFQRMPGLVHLLHGFQARRVMIGHLIYPISPGGGGGAVTLPKNSASFSATSSPGMRVPKKTANPCASLT